ncbi:MAG TPA: hypothetical protein VFM90_03860, partial [Cyclobacteriaceae bacterium]|nr:hypothetical protein [Cyclobacteriaceae bacterium]
AVLFFLAASSKTKRLLLLFTPFIFLIGGLVSILVLASRVNQDPFVLFEYFAPQNFLNALSMSALFVTEGLSLGALFELAGTTLLSPDLGYLVGRLVTFPFPGSLIDKLPPFNIQAAALIYGKVTEHSINTTLLGIFVYSFGVLAIPIIPYVVFLIYKLDRHIHRKYGNVARILFFCLAFAGFRFNFEFFIVHVIYFLLLATVLKRRLIRINGRFGTFRTSSPPSP